MDVHTGLQRQEVPTCIIYPPCHSLSLLSLSTLVVVLPVSLSSLLLFISIGGNMAVSTHSTLRVIACSSGGWVLGLEVAGGLSWHSGPV
jgi:hypothetical protein